MEFLLTLALIFSNKEITVNNQVELKQLIVAKQYLGSWYGEKDSCHYKGCPTASGERYNEDKISCASRTYFGKTLRIEHDGKSIFCKVNDKIAWWLDKERVDLSKAAFLALHPNLDDGIIKINVYE